MEVKMEFLFSTAEAEEIRDQALKANVRRQLDPPHSYHLEVVDTGWKGIRVEAVKNAPPVPESPAAVPAVESIEADADPVAVSPPVQI